MFRSFFAFLIFLTAGFFATAGNALLTAQNETANDNSETITIQVVNTEKPASSDTAPNNEPSLPQPKQPAPETAPPKKAPPPSADKKENPIIIPSQPEKANTAEASKPLQPAPAAQKSTVTTAPVVKKPSLPANTLPSQNQMAVPSFNTPSYYPPGEQMAVPFPSQQQEDTYYNPSFTSSDNSGGKLRKHRLSLNGNVVPFFKDGRKRQMFIDFMVDYGYGNGDIEFGPYASSNFSFDYDGIFGLGENSNLSIGGFAEYHFFKNTTKRGYLPSLGFQIGYGFLERRNSLVLRPYFSMKFFVTPSTAIFVSARAFWYFVFDGRGTDYGIDTPFGFVHYFF